MMDLGKTAVELILSLAQLLVSEGAPGWVAIGMVTTLIVMILFYGARNIYQIQSASDLKNRLLKYPDNYTFSKAFEDFRADLSDFQYKSNSHKIIRQNWEEYAETLVRDDLDGVITLRNSVRPSNFLNIEDLGFNAGLYRIIPSTFVSVGLLCTFLGLVAALSALGADLTENKATDKVVISLMNIASAKFTMSLVGLACSIIFGLFIRWRQGILEKMLHDLCLVLERRLVFVSLEDLGFRQIRAAEEQREHLREVGMAMVAQLSEPLIQLPNSITKAMEPMFEQVRQLGTSSLQGMVGDLSGQISQSVGNALTRASEALGEASEKISHIVERMDNSNAQMGLGMQTALTEMAVSISNLKAQVEATGQTASNTMNQGAERLLSVMNDTLEGIKQNTGDGARAISSAAEEMRKSAETFRTELNQATLDGTETARLKIEKVTEKAESAIAGAGAALMEAFGKTSQDIANIGETIGAQIGGDITARLFALVEQLRNISAAIMENASGMRTASTAIKSGGEAMAAASTAFGGASRQMIEAIDPVRESHLRIENSVQAISNQTRAAVDVVTRSSETVARDAARILESAQTALGNERDGIVKSLQAIRDMLNMLVQTATKFDDIDNQLGKALKEYSEQLEGALGLAQGHIEKMRDTLGPGIDTLSSVIERAETFIPSSRRA